MLENIDVQSFILVHLAEKDSRLILQLLNLAKDVKLQLTFSQRLIKC